jgi:chromosome segregation ATPase
MKETCKDLESKLADALVDADSLRRSPQMASPGVRGEVSELERKNAELERQIDVVLRTSVQGNSQRADVLRVATDKLSRAEWEAANLKKDLQASQAALSRMASHSGASQEKLFELETQLAEYQQQLQAASGSGGVENDLALLTKQLEDLSRESEARKRSEQDLLGQLVSLRAELRACREQRDAAISSAEQGLTRLKKLEKQLHDERGKHSFTESDPNAQSSERKLLALQKSALSKELASVYKAMEVLEAQLIKTKKENAKLVGAESRARHAADFEAAVESSSLARSYHAPPKLNQTAVGSRG